MAYSDQVRVTITHNGITATVSLSKYGIEAAENPAEYLGLQILRAYEIAKREETAQ